MGIALDQEADVPLGVQLDWSIRAAIASGRLRPGDRLPALRDVAADLGVNHNTIRAAVARLEADGLLETRHGAGTFVAAGVTAHVRHTELLDEVVRAARDSGLGPRELAAALYVSGAPAPEFDGGAYERRVLRDEIAVLERLVMSREAELPVPLPAPRTAPSRASRGPRLLDADQLRAQRDALVQRLVVVQGALDAAEQAIAAEQAAAAAARASAPAQRRRAPRPGIAPA
jgi:GntR family transcriptional regulator